MPCRGWSLVDPNRDVLESPKKYSEYMIPYDLACQPIEHKDSSNLKSNEVGTILEEFHMNLYHVTLDLQESYFDSPIRFVASDDPSSLMPLGLWTAVVPNLFVFAGFQFIQYNTINCSQTWLRHVKLQRDFRCWCDFANKTLSVVLSSMSTSNLGPQVAVKSFSTQHDAV